MDLSRSTRITARGLWLAFSNITLSALFGLFAYAHSLNFLRYYRSSNLLVVTKESLDAFFFLTRRAPLQSSRSFYDWAVGIAGLLVPLLFRPVERPFDFLVGQFLQSAGLVLQILGMLSLSRSFGVVAANRGIKTGGLYRIVRHPLYSSYIIGHIGYILNNLSTRNILLFSISTALQVQRVFVEERFLGHDESYAKYARRTRWRLLPFIF